MYATPTPSYPPGTSSGLIRVGGVSGALNTVILLLTIVQSESIVSRILPPFGGHLLHELASRTRRMILNLFRSEYKGKKQDLVAPTKQGNFATHRMNAKQG